MDENGSRHDGPCMTGGGFRAEGVPAAPRPRRVYAVLAAVYFVFVIYGSLVPFRYTPVPLAEAWRRFQDIAYLDLSIASRSDFVANILLFVPLAFAVMGALAGPAGRARRHLWAALVIPAGFLLAVTIEFVQIQFPGRTVSQNDILAETTGGAIGAFLWIAFGARITRWWTALWQSHGAGRRTMQILMGYFVVWVAYQWFPFDFTHSPVHIYRQWNDGKITVVPFADRHAIEPYQYVTKTVSVIPLAWLFVLWRRRAPYRSADAVLLTMGCALVAEMGQLIVFSRSSSVTDLVFALGGALMGIAVARHVGPTARVPLNRRPAWRRVASYVLWMATLLAIAVLAASAWRAFTFHYPPEGFASAAAGAFLRPPLQNYYTLPESLAAAQAIRRIAAYLALGMLLRSLARWREGRGLLAATVAVIGVSAVLEVGQLLVPGRTADLTTIVYQSIGGAMGAALLPGFVRVLIEGDTAADDAL